MTIPARHSAVLLLLFSFLIIGNVLNAQFRPPTKVWAKSYGGTGRDEARAMVETTDGGYVIAGMGQSMDGDITDNNPQKNNWIVRTDVLGNILWKKSYGDNGEGINSIIQTSDGGFAATGMVPGVGMDIGNYWILKTDANGNMQWEKIYGGSGHDRPFSLVQTSDGGYAVAGVTQSHDGNIVDRPFAPDFESDYWIIKLNTAGTLQWTKTYGGDNADESHSIIETTDGGLAFAGVSYSNNNGDITDHKGSGGNAWLVKTDAVGTIQWSKSYGGAAGTGTCVAYSIVQTPDNGYALGGMANQNGGDVTDNHGDLDCWVVKTGTTGIIQWTKSYGGTSEEYLYSLVVSKHGGLILAGGAYSTNGDVKNNYGYFDYWVVAIDDAGNITRSNNYGGTDYDMATSVRETKDDGIIISGISMSVNGDVTDHRNNADYWVIKIANKIATAHTVSLDYCPGYSIVVKDTLYGTFNPNNTFSVQLSDASGSFLNPLTLGDFPNNNKDSLFTVILPTTLTPGTGYRVRVVSTSPAAFYTDNGQDINIHAGPAVPPGFLGKDTTLCTGNNLLLQAPPGYEYRWQDNSAAGNFNVTVNGKYFLRVSNPIGCSVSDTILVDIKSLASFTLGKDTGICPGKTILLQPVLPAGNYTWSTGSASPSIQVITPGKYWLKVSDGGCSQSDTIVVAGKINPVINLGKDTTICNGQPITLDVTNTNATYLWQDGSAQAKFVVTKDGVFTVKVTAAGCDTTGVVAIDYRSKPSFSLGADTTICNNEPLVLNAFYPDSRYEWNDGSTNSKITVASAGTYSVSVSNNCGITTDAVRVDYGSCDCKFTFPTAFTPNNDGKNDVFKPLTQCTISNYELKIFNRWGQLVFVSHNSHAGWGGGFSNKRQQADVYIWTLQYKDPLTGKMDQKKGTVLLMQ